MTENVCLVCLKTFQSFPNNGPSLSLRSLPPQDEKCGATLLTKFLKFAKNYLKVSSPVPSINRSKGEIFPDAFCEKCELAVITPICQVYLEYLSAQLRLSWELEQLGKLLDSSQLDMSNQSRVVSLGKLTEQLGVEDPSNLEEFRSLLSQKCQLKRKETLPEVLVQSRCRNDEIIRLPIDSLSESNDDDSDENDDDDDEDFDPSDSGAVDPLDEQSDEDETEETNDVIENGSFELKNMVIKIKVEPVQLPQDDHLMVVPESEEVEEEADDHQYSNSALDSWHKCSKCDRFFESLKGLHQHIIKCSGIKKQDTEVTVAFPCGICEKIFPTGKSWYNHKSRAHSTKRYKCSKCNYVTKEKGDLKHHFVAIHNPQTHVCGQCKKTFACSKYLKYHIRRAHPLPGQAQLFRRRQQRKFFCPNSTCDKHFSTKTMLNCHLTKCCYSASAPTKNEVNASNIIQIEEATPMEESNIIIAD